MDNYIEIESQKDLNEFINSKVSFHDSMIKEMQMLNRGFVHENLAMDMGHRF